MTLQDYRSFLSLNESIQGDLTLPMLRKFSQGKNFSYQEAVNKASGSDKSALENEALFLKDKLETRDSVGGKLGEYMVASIFGGSQTNTQGDANTIFYDVEIDRAYYSIKTSFAKEANSPSSCINNSKLKRNNVLSIFASDGVPLKPVDESSVPLYAMDLYNLCEGNSSLGGGGTPFGVGLVYIKDGKFQVFLSKTSTKKDLFEIIKRDWAKVRKKVKQEINESNVVSLFLDEVLPSDSKGRLVSPWAGTGIISYFGGEDAATIIDIEVVSTAMRVDVLKFVNNLDTEVLLNFAKSQGYKG